MLDSVKIQRRQSEIRQELAELVGKEKPTEDETRQIETLDAEFRTNETRYRAALISEDQERREAGAELETREGRQWADLVGQFEMRQVALHLDEGRSLDGATGEIVQELRAAGGFRGVPVPWQALETRNTVASGTPDPVATRPIIDRLFPDSMAGRMGGCAFAGGAYRRPRSDHRAGQPGAAAGGALKCRSTRGGSSHGPNVTRRGASSPVCEARP